MKALRPEFVAIGMLLLLAPSICAATTYRATLNCTSGFTGVRITGIDFWCSDVPCAPGLVCLGDPSPICPGLVASFGTGNLSCANVLDPDKVRDFVLSDDCGYQISCLHAPVTVTCRRWVRVFYECSLYPGVIRSVCMRVPGSVSLGCGPAAAGKSGRDAIADDEARFTIQEVLPEAAVPTDCLPPPRPLDGPSIAVFGGGAVTLGPLEILGLGPCMPTPGLVPVTNPVNGILAGSVSTLGPAVPFSAPVSGLLRSQLSSAGPDLRFFETELLSLGLVGLPLPGGVLVRESPALASEGMTTMRGAPGVFWATNTLDLYLEVSLDGGITWLPSTDALGNPEPVRLRLRQEPTDAADATAPAHTVLHGCVPNPFNPTTTIAFELARGGRVSLRILDAAGRVVRDLVHEPMAAGRHELSWNGTDGSGRRVPSGVYLYQLTAGDYTATQKMVLLK